MVQSLSQEDPLEEEVATYCSILAWKIPPTEESGGLLSIESQRDSPTEAAALTRCKACSRQCGPPSYCHSHSLRGWPPWWTMAPLCLDAFCSFTLSSLTLISRIEKCNYHFIQVHFAAPFWYWFFLVPILPSTYSWAHLFFSLSSLVFILLGLPPLSMMEEDT